MSRKPAPFPTRDEILDWVRRNPQSATKRDIAKAFGIKGAERVELKRVLREMAEDGLIDTRRRRASIKGALPPVAVLIAGAPDADGDVFATPEHWEGEDAAPRIIIRSARQGESFGEGDRILCKLEETPEAEDHAFAAKVIKKIGSGPKRIMGVYRADQRGGRVVPVSKGEAKDWLVPEGKQGDAQDGELVEAELLPKSRHSYGPPRVQVVKVLGDPMAPRAVSLIAIEEHGIPTDWPQDALDEAEAAAPVELGEREDLRGIPLLTIDPADARDHDDAVCALPDEDPENEGGWIVWVAIADVAHYVRPGSSIDKEARRRGNSTYFPDRVVPMLPEALSADLCSLHEGVDRACIAVRMVLDADGKKIAHRFTRGLMRSAASLTYQQAQAADDGKLDADTEALAGPLADLYAAWRAATAQKGRRQPLDLDLPERKIELSEEGEVLNVSFRDRLDAHRLIEEFMILANVCAAETLNGARRAAVYRVHEEPGPEKVDALREQAESVGLALARGQVTTTAQFNRLLDQAAGTDFAEFINISVLRAQTQAYYGTEALGHFGLNLRLYAHFTSPIRRYADLIVHRALIAVHEGDGAPDGPRPEDEQELRETAQHISFTERRSMNAERDTNDRYLSAFLRDRVGAEFEGKVAGIARFGIFVKLDETGADGLVPIGSIGGEYWHHDADSQVLIGDRSGTVISLGQRARVKLLEAIPVTGGLLFELLSLEGGPSPAGGGGRGPDAGRRTRRGPGNAPRKKLSKGRIAKAKAGRKRR
ncbi:ribonuclease R [Rhodovulum sp. DZ06]|uniref:ribonuclease R n=1 Tax=Rhodovulum sp. DZ06 TaxID=3425126 RepID=UPI003D34A01E